MKRNRIIVDNPKIIDGLKVIQDYGEIAEALENGETVMHWEAGTSLSPIINHLEYCKIVPIKNINDVKRGDCVFCKLTNKNTDVPHYMVHQVWEISDAAYDGELWFKIGSSMSYIYGWTNEVLGLAYGTNIYQDSNVWDKICQEM